MGEIEEAIERYTDRKVSAQVSGRRMTSVEQARLALSGTDLDYDELVRLRSSVAENLAQGVSAGIPLFEIVFGMWLEGMVVGVEVEKARP